MEWDRAAAFGTAAVPALTAAIGDGEAHVRESAAEALGRTRAASAVTLLVAALRDKEPRVQRAAAIGLGRFGAEAKEAVEPLTRAASASDDKLARAASDAAEKIRKAAETRA